MRFFRSKPARHRYGPVLEALEGRCTPANVTGVVESGVLTLTADEGAAEESLSIRVAEVGGPGAVSISGSAGTTVNGRSSDDFRGVRSLMIRLRGGNDTFQWFTLDLPGNVFFDGRPTSSSTPSCSG